MLDGVIAWKRQRWEILPPDDSTHVFQLQNSESNEAVSFCPLTYGCTWSGCVLPLSFSKFSRARIPLTSCLAGFSFGRFIRRNDSKSRLKPISASFMDLRGCFRSSEIVVIGLRVEKKKSEKSGLTFDEAFAIFSLNIHCQRKGISMKILSIWLGIGLIVMVSLGDRSNAGSGRIGTSDRPLAAKPGWQKKDVGFAGCSEVFHYPSQIKNGASWEARVGHLASLIGSIETGETHGAEHLPSGQRFESNQWQIDEMLLRADSLLRHAQFDAARKIYQGALKIEPNSLPARIGLGRVAMAQEKWADANEQFLKILSDEPENKDAHYYSAICYRETGKFKVLLLRKLDWDKSKKHFEWILARDSLFKDVVFQWAVLHRYQEKYQTAVQLGHRQIQLRPELVEPQVKIFRFYRYLISHLPGPAALAWLHQQPWDHARFAIGELYRRAGQLAQADSIFASLLQSPLSMSRQPIYLSLAKIHYQQNEPDIGQRFYWQAVDAIQNDVDAELVFEDLKYILSDQELERFRSLSAIPQKIEFFRALWRQRDPTPAASINYRLAEHYRRLLYAEQHYEFDGFRTWFNSPDKLGYLNFPQVYQLNEEFHDKGLIYIRHGQYDDWAMTAGEDVPGNETWVYYPTATSPKMVFHFILENTPGLWRFTPIITELNLLEDRVQFGHIYYRLLQSDPLEQPALINEMARESQQSVFIGLSTDRHSWDKAIKPLEVAFMLSSFRGDSGRTAVEIYNAFSLSPLIESSKVEPQQVVLEKGIMFHNRAWQEIEHWHEASPVTVTKQGYYVDLHRFEVPPDSYHVAFFLRPEQNDFLGGWKIDTAIPDYRAARLALSDIQLATTIAPADQPGKFVKHGLLVVPNPMRRFELNKPVYIYFEVYHLTPNGEGKTSFSIEYKLTLKKRGKKGLAGFWSREGKSSIATQIEREGKGEMSVEYLAIDVSQLKAGDYELEVTVTDRHTRSSARKTRAILLHERK